VAYVWGHIHCFASNLGWIRDLGIVPGLGIIVVLDGLGCHSAMSVVVVIIWVRTAHIKMWSVHLVWVTYHIPMICLKMVQYENLAPVRKGLGF
jgi:hypothetical protein